MAADAALSVTLEGGKFKALRLRNLPRDANVAVVVQASGKLAVSLLNESDYKTYPRASEPVFAGTVDRQLSFQIVIPDSGNYYLVLDNRQSTEARKVKLGIRAERGRSSPAPDKPSLPAPSLERKQGT